MNWLQRTSARIGQGAGRSLSRLLGGHMASHALRLLSSLLLTRLLLPEAFGLMSVVQTLLFALALLSDIGLSQSVVMQHARMPEGFMGTVRCLQLLRGAILALALLGLAALLEPLQHQPQSWLSGVFADPRLPQFVLAVCLLPLIQAHEPVDLHRALARMRTGLLARVELSGQLAGLLVSVLAAWASASPWALIVGAYASALTRCLAAHRLCRPRPVPLHWQAAHVRQIWQGGRWILLSSLLGLLASQSDKLIAAAYLPAQPMGYLAVALALLMAPQGLLSAINAQMVLPMLAARTDDAAHLAMQRIQSLMDLGLGLLAGLLLSLGPLLVVWLYSTTYAPAGQLFGWLSLGLLGMRYQSLEQWMITRGHSHWVTLNNALRTLMLWLGMPWAHHHFGAQAIVWVMVAAQFAPWLTVWIYQIRARTWSMRRAWQWPLALGAGTLAGWAVRQLLQWLTA